MSILYKKDLGEDPIKEETPSMWDKAASSISNVFSSPDNTDWSKSMRSSNGMWEGDENKIKAKQKELGIKEDGKWGDDSVNAWKKLRDSKAVKLDVEATPKEAGFFSDLFSSNKIANADILSGEWLNAASEDEIMEVQRKAGLTGEDVDGVWGDGSKAAWLESLEKGDILDMMDGMPKYEQMKTFGITDELLDRSGLTHTARKSMNENVTPQYYRVGEAVEALVAGKKDPYRDAFDKRTDKSSYARLDALALSTGFRQKHGTYAVSSHKPGKDIEELWGLPYTGTDVTDSTTYYTYADRGEFVKRMMGQIGTLEEWKKSGNTGGYQTGYMGGVLSSAGVNVVDMGEDEEGQFMSFYDKNDYIKGSDSIAKSFKIYDKIYVKKVGNRWQYKDDKGKWRAWGGNTKQSKASKRTTKEAMDRDASTSYSDIAKEAIKGLFKGFSFGSGGIMYRNGGKIL